MIKTTAIKPDGTKLLLLGLSFGNLTKFREQPGETFIDVLKADTGIDCDIVIYSGETEAACLQTLREAFGPGVTVSVENGLRH